MTASLSPPAAGPAAHHDMTPHPHKTARTLLFVPGNRPERFAKAAATAADLVVVDLEDAVPDENKATARDTNELVTR